MAYIDQKKKAEIEAALKKVIPASWKYSLAIQNHSTLCLTIYSAPRDLVTANLRPVHRKAHGCITLNPYYIKHEYDGELLELFQRILAAMNAGNYDHSDVQSDYFDVGWYVSVNIGKSDRPFVAGS